MQGAKERATELRKSLKQKIHQHRRVPSFSEAEAFFLSGLLIDEPRVDDHEGEGKESKEGEKRSGSSGELNDEVLFSIPPANLSGQPAELPAHHKPANRRSIVGLWKAHEQGVHPRVLSRRASLEDNDNIDNEADPLKGKEIVANGVNVKVKDEDQTAATEQVEDEGDFNDAATDVEVRPDATSDASDASSWADTEHQDNFDTWEVLKDEYAGDFGFDYTHRGASVDSVLNGEDVGNVFKILGTSADDMSVQPHVLSPPLMDALASFLPDGATGENFWLRYSLVRDGASLDTMRSYVRGAQYTIIAIETPKGEVFGSFTSSPWRTNFGYFGGQPSFVWKMRPNRLQKCSSLFEQAKLESEVDVYMCTHKKELVQVCRRDQLAVGGDKFDEKATLLEDDEVDLDQSGFAFSLENDLLLGTTSPCGSFSSPALVGKGDVSQVFDVAGLEVWSLTPCFDIPSAQKLEMTKYFIEESVRSGASSTRSLNSRTGGGFSGNDLTSERFYQRVGQDFESQERRQRWQRTNMMNPESHSAGAQHSPRFM